MTEPQPLPLNASLCPPPSPPTIVHQCPGPFVVRTDLSFGGTRAVASGSLVMALSARAVEQFGWCQAVRQCHAPRRCGSAGPPMTAATGSHTPTRPRAPGVPGGAARASVRRGDPRRRIGRVGADGGWRPRPRGARAVAQCAEMSMDRCARGMGWGLAEWQWGMTAVARPPGPVLRGRSRRAADFGGIRGPSR